MSNDKDTFSPDEQDLSELFDAHKEAVPAALDQLILNAARNAVSDKDKDKDKDKGKGKGKGKSSGPSPGAWFAIAASLLLGVTITPLLLQAPESSLKSSAHSIEAVSAVDSAVAHESINTVTATPMVSALRTPNPAARSADRPLAEADAETDQYPYRQSAQNWLKHIRHLMDEQQRDVAKTEYKLFRKAYPEFEPDFHLGTR